MFRAERLPDGRIRVPRTVEGPGGLIGDAVVTLNPGDPGYAEAAAHIRQRDSGTAPRRGFTPPPVDPNDGPLY